MKKFSNSINKINKILASPKIHLIMMYNLIILIYNNFYSI
jgi:hypothetical protein